MTDRGLPDRGQVLPYWCITGRSARHVFAASRVGVERVYRNYLACEERLVRYPQVEDQTKEFSLSSRSASAGSSG